MTPPLIEIADVEFGYADVPVVSDINIQIERGEFVCLLGPSGCGKSTLLNMVAGLLKPWSGTVLFEGNPVTTINQDVGYMTQEDTLLPWRTTESNIKLPLKIRKTPRDEIGKRVDFYLDLLNLAPARHRFPSQLSGGMKRRALLARSLIYDPRSLLMDEPFGAIDASLRVDLHTSLRAAVERLKQTVMFVTHDVSEAVLLSDRVIVFGGGPTSTVISEVESPFPRRGRSLNRIVTSAEFGDMEALLRKTLSAGAANKASVSQEVARRGGTGSC